MIAENKLEILDIESNNLMDLIAKILKDDKRKDVILYNISYYFGGDMTYIENWGLKERTKKIRAMYIRKYKGTGKSQAEIYRNITMDVKQEIQKQRFPIVPVNERIVKHAIEGQ